MEVRKTKKNQVEQRREKKQIFQKRKYEITNKIENLSKKKKSRMFQK